MMKTKSNKIKYFKKTFSTLNQNNSNMISLRPSFKSREESELKKVTSVLRKTFNYFGRLDSKQTSMFITACRDDDVKNRITITSQRDLFTLISCMLCSREERTLVVVDSKVQAKFLRNNYKGDYLNPWDSREILDETKSQPIFTSVQAVVNMFSEDLINAKTRHFSIVYVPGLGISDEIIRFDAMMELVASKKFPNYHCGKYFSVTKERDVQPIPFINTGNFLGLKSFQKLARKIHSNLELLSIGLWESFTDKRIIILVPTDIHIRAVKAFLFGNIANSFITSDLNEYTTIRKGKNIILVCKSESVSPIFIEADILIDSNMEKTRGLVEPVKIQGETLVLRDRWRKEIALSLVKPGGAYLHNFDEFPKFVTNYIPDKDVTSFIRSLMQVFGLNVNQMLNCEILSQCLNEDHYKFIDTRMNIPISFFTTPSISNKVMSYFLRTKDPHIAAVLGSVLSFNSNEMEELEIEDFGDRWSNINSMILKVQGALINNKYNVGKKLTSRLLIAKSFLKHLGAEKLEKTSICTESLDASLLEGPQPFYVMDVIKYDHIHGYICAHTMGGTYASHIHPTKAGDVSIHPDIIYASSFSNCSSLCFLPHVPHTGRTCVNYSSIIVNNAETAKHCLPNLFSRILHSKENIYLVRTEYLRHAQRVLDLFASIDKGAFFYRKGNISISFDENMRDCNKETVEQLFSHGDKIVRIPIEFLEQAIENSILNNSGAITGDRYGNFYTFRENSSMISAINCIQAPINTIFLDTTVMCNRLMTHVLFENLKQASSYRLGFTLMIDYEDIFGVPKIPESLEFTDPLGTKFHQYFISSLNLINPKRDLMTLNENIDSRQFREEEEDKSVVVGEYYNTETHKIPESVLRFMDNGSLMPHVSRTGVTILTYYPYNSEVIRENNSISSSEAGEEDCSVYLEKLICLSRVGYSKDYVCTYSCDNEDEIKGVIKCYNCSQNICHGCFLSYVNYHIDTETVNTPDKIICPNCSKGFPLGFIRDFVPPRTFDNLTRSLGNLAIRYLSSSGNMKPCPYPNCDAWCKSENPEAKGYFCLKCEKCSGLFCQNCLNMPHEGSPCSKSEEVFLGNYRHCPNCSMKVEKQLGCNHIHCVCGTHWCWVCGWYDTDPNMEENEGIMIHMTRAGHPGY